MQRPCIYDRNGDDQKGENRQKILRRYLWYYIGQINWQHCDVEWSMLYLVSL